MKPLALAALVLLLTSDAAASCPEEAPVPGGMLLTSDCTPAHSCPDNAPVAFALERYDSFFPPFGEGYAIQPCDEVTWDFGDGTAPVSATGSGTATHTWTVPGNYTVTVAVKNAKGEATYGRPYVAATNPAMVGMIEKRVRETEPLVELTFTRTGETSRRVSATVRRQVDPYGVDPVLHAGVTEVVFETGETSKTVALPLFDNQVFDGLRIAGMDWAGAGGGVIFKGYRPVLWIEDDEPQPRLIVDDVAVAEGDTGRTKVVVPVRLSAPIGTYLNLHGAVWEGTAGRDDYDWRTEGTQIRAGDLTGTIEFSLAGDTELELDETLQLSTGPYGGIPAHPVNAPRATITILNDDTGITPSRSSGLIGETLRFTLFAGLRSDTSRSFPVRVTDASVVSAPAMVTVPARAVTAPLEVHLVGEGLARVEVDVDPHTVGATVTAAMQRAILRTPDALRLVRGRSAVVTLSLAPPLEEPLTVTLTASPYVLAVPERVTIPAAGEVAFEVRALAVGGAAIGVTSSVEGIMGTAVIVDVIPPAKRRAMR